MQDTKTVVHCFFNSQLNKFIKRTQGYLEGVQELLDNCQDDGISYFNIVVESEEESPKEVKQKKEKDPDAPKQPFSSFILYSIDQRNAMKAKKSGKYQEKMDRTK